MPAPHRPLKNYYAHEAERPRWVQHLFDRTAQDYDRVERLMAFGSGSIYRRLALARAKLRAGMQVLDVGTGTGLTARAAVRLVGPSGHVTGIDPSPGMLASAVVPPGVDLKLGSAESIPMEAESVDFLCMGYALRHVSDMNLAFREFLRVLKPGGSLCILEITSPEGRVGRSLLKAYMRGVVPLMTRCIARDRDAPTLMRYYWDTIEACASPGTIMGAIREAGFVEVWRTLSLGVFSEYCARKG